MRRYGDAPYQSDHAGSIARKAQPPKNLLGWFMAAYREEPPLRVHSRDVWRDRVSADEERNGVRAVGGSLLGSPRTNDAFRTYIEERPQITERAEFDGHTELQPSYKYPLRAALAELGGRGKSTDEFPFMARVLYRTAMRDGDWDGACASMGICQPVRRVYVEEALRRLWRHYREEPPARTIRTDAA